MSKRLFRVGALGMAVVLAGCTAAPMKPAVEPIAFESEAPAECAASAPSTHAGARLARAVGYGTLGVFLGALQGASEGANWAWGSGGSRSNAVWIGAATGAGVGVGFLVGFVTSLAKGGGGWSPEPTTNPACQATSTETTATEEDNLETASTK